MPRPRLTLGRLMAWIAFAAVNLAVLGALYRKAKQSGSDLGARWGTGLLGLAYVFAYLGYRLLRVYFAPFEETSDGKTEWVKSGCLAPIGVGVTMMVLLSVVMALIAALSR